MVCPAPIRRCDGRVPFANLSSEPAPFSTGLQERQCLQRGDLKALAAANVAAGHHVVAAHHVGLRLGKSGSVAVVGVARQLRPLAPYDPTDGVIAWLAAVRTDQRMGTLLVGFGKKIAFFHNWVNSQLSSRTKVFHTRGCHDETKKREVLGNQGGQVQCARCGGPAQGQPHCGRPA